MPLLDHFHPPLSRERHWESFHSSWANEIMAYLNQGALPPGYFAETQIHFGNRIEVDVAALENQENKPLDHDRNGGLALETLTATEILVMPAVFPDLIEVQVFEDAGGANLVGAIELVSPANKDRPETKRAFAAKCAAYLQAKIGLLVIDVVTDRRGNLHNELIKLLEQNQALGFPANPSLYTVSYRPIRTQSDGDQIEMRLFPLEIGQALPTMPLSLRRGPKVVIDLDATYLKTRERNKL